MPHRPPHQSLRINGVEKPRDPLAPKQHQILIEVAPGEFTVISDNIEEPIELLRMKVARDHPLAFKNNNVLIVDKESREVAERYEHYRPVKVQDPETPITPANQRVRDRWILNIIKWLLPQELREAPKDSTDMKLLIKQCMDQQKVTVSISPSGCLVVFQREGSELASWSCGV